MNFNSIGFEGLDATLVSTIFTIGETRAANLIEGYVDSSARKRLGYEEIARGAEKVVYIPVYSQSRDEEGVGKQEKVYYAPVETFFIDREKPLREEKAKMDRIRKILDNPSEQLALEAKEMEGDQRIDGKYTLEVERAIGDLEKEISKAISIEQRITFGSDYVNGLRDLHNAEFAYGDPKPANCLIYKSKSKNNRLKISDFGKAKKIADEQTEYTGNTRFAPPEGTLSKKGDVYGGALILIRIFEEQYLDGTKQTLLEVKEEDTDVPPSKSLKGIERYIVQHKAFPGCESQGSEGKIRSIHRRILTMGELSNTEEQNHEHALHGYIEQLETTMIENDVDSEKAVQFADLLKEMTKSDFQLRPTMQEVVTRYHQIFDH